MKKNDSADPYGVIVSWPGASAPDQRSLGVVDSIVPRFDLPKSGAIKSPAFMGLHHI